MINLLAGHEVNRILYCTLGEGSQVVKRESQVREGTWAWKEREVLPTSRAEEWTE